MKKVSNKLQSLVNRIQVLQEEIDNLRCDIEYKIDDLECEENVNEKRLKNLTKI